MEAHGGNLPRVTGRYRLDNSAGIDLDRATGIQVNSYSSKIGSLDVDGSCLLA